MDVFIEKISQNKEGILFIKPKGYSFSMIYRSAMGVQWDENTKSLYHNPTKDWDAIQWYKQILSAVKSEYGAELKVCSKTIYENIDEKTKTVIKHA